MSDEMLHAMPINEIEKTRVEILAELVMLQSEMMARLDRIGEQLVEIRDDIQRRFRRSIRIVPGFAALLALCALFLTSCATTVPVAVIGQDGRVLRGTNTFSLSEGSFTVTDGKLTCGGSYNPLSHSQTISMPVTCNDGRKGIVRATRDSSVSGSGTVRLNDGYQGDFLFGTAAANF